MQFVELSFLLGYLPLTLLLHRVAVSFNSGKVYGSSARIVLFLATLFFYGFKEPWWLIPFGVCIGFDFYWSRRIAFSQSEKSRTVWLACSVFQNLALLGFFKYYNFILSIFGLEGVLSKSTLSLPPGISFYTFESLSFVIDVYRRVISPPQSPLQFFAFIGMFPRFIAGPIVRYKDLVEQFSHYPGMQWEKGFKKFALGFFLKLAIADRFAAWVPYAFGNESLGLLHSWIGVLSYTFQIYFDFYGYSLMAIGLGEILGFEFPENFKAPYSSNSLKDFWRRWHISLSTWLRDYLYIPLGGNQKSIWKTYRNLMITMLLGGLWHGANWTFVIWGLIHGLGLAIEKAIGLSFGRVGTFLVVVVAWIFFRAESIQQAIHVLSALFNFNNSFNLTAHITPILWCVTGMIYVHFFEGKLKSMKWQWLTFLENRISLGFVILALVVPLKNDISQIPFLYFQF